MRSGGFWRVSHQNDPQSREPYTCIGVSAKLPDDAFSQSNVFDLLNNRIRLEWQSRRDRIFRTEVESVEPKLYRLCNHSLQILFTLSDLSARYLTYKSARYIGRQKIESADMCGRLFCTSNLSASYQYYYSPGNRVHVFQQTNSVIEYTFHDPCNT